jgi:hypothetical protein
MIADSNRKWWVLSAALLILASGLVLAIACYMHYLRDDSDLIAVDARAQRLGIPQMAASQVISSTQEQAALSAADADVNRLKNFDLCMPRIMTQMWAFSTSRTDYQENLPNVRNLVDSWGALTCARIESDIDALAEHPIITSDALYSPTDGRWPISAFLAIRLMSAQPQQVSERELRLARYLLTFDPVSVGRMAWDELSYLTCRLDEVDSHRGEISRVLQRFADNLPGSMRCYLAMSYRHRMASARQEGITGMRALGAFPGWIDSSLPLASWEVRRWRAPVLQHWIDTFTTLDCAAASAASARAMQSAQSSLFALGRSAYDLRQYQEFSERACKTLVMIQAIQARVDGKPMPHDPFAPANQRLRSRIMGDCILFYSIGRDGIDNGGRQGDLPILHAWTSSKSLPPVR